MALNVTITDLSGTTAYFRFGGNTSSVRGSYQGQALSGSTVIRIENGQTIRGLTLDSIIGGKMLFSLQSPLSGSEPAFQAGSGPDAAIRWDKVELTYDGSPYGAANLTSTDFFGLDLGIQTLDKAGKPLSSVGWSLGATQVFADLARISGQNPLAVVTGAGGDPVPGVGSVLRVIAPSTVPTSALGSYPSFASYVDAVRTGQVVTHVVGTYNGIGGASAPGQKPQTYDFSMRIDAAGNMVMTGGATGIGGGPSVGGNHTVVVAAADLLTGVYSADPFYTVDGQSVSPYGGQRYAIGNNDVYATAVRDALSGFDFGFVGSTATDPLTGKRYVDEPTNLWYQASATRPGQAFGYAQSNPLFYNQFAAEIARNSGSYGFPFSDLLGHPLINLDPNQVGTLAITIYPDTLTPTPPPVPALFDAAYYSATYAGLIPAGTDAYVDYASVGWKAGRNPSAGFDGQAYLAANPDVKAAGIDPLLHYTTFGKAEGRMIFPVAGVSDFDPSYYTRTRLT